MNVVVRFNRELETENERAFLVELQTALQTVADIFTSMGGEPEAIAEMIEQILPNVLTGLAVSAPKDAREHLRLVINNDA